VKDVAHLLDAPVNCNLSRTHPYLLPCASKVALGSLCVWRERRLDSDLETLRMEHTPQVDGCQHRSAIRAATRLLRSLLLEKQMRRQSESAAVAGA